MVPPSIRFRKNLKASLPSTKATKMTMSIMMTLFAVSDMAFPPFHIDTRQILIYNNDETFVFSDVTIMPPRVLRVNM